MKLFSNIKTKLFLLPLVRLWYKLKLVMFKKSSKLQLIVAQIVRYRIRIIHDVAVLEGYDEKFDAVVTVSALMILTPEIFQDKLPIIFERYTNNELIDLYRKRKKEYMANKAAIDKIIEDISENKEILRLKNLYFQIRAYAARILNDQKDESDYFLSKARELNGNLPSLTDKEILGLRKPLIKELKELRSQISDRQAIKIDLSLNDIGTAISLVATIFLMSGYLYNNFFLSEYGISVANFFSLSDYLSSSIDVIRYSASGAFLGLLSFYVGLHRASRESYHEIQSRKLWRIEPYIVLTGFIVLSVFAWIRNQAIFYDMLYFVILFITMIFTPDIAKRYFKKPITAIFLIVFVCAFAGHMFTSLGKNIFNLKHSDITELKKYNFKFSNAIKLPNEEIILLAGNSNYFFFLNKKTNISYIVKKEDIVYLENIHAIK